MYAIKSIYTIEFELTYYDIKSILLPGFLAIYCIVPFNEMSF